MIRVSDVKADDRRLAHTTVLKLEERVHHGLRPLLGVNLIAGVTGCGKTLLAEALWLGVAHTVNLLSAMRLTRALESAIKAYGIRNLDLKFTACFDEVEIGREMCIETEVRRSLRAYAELPRDEEVRRRILYALLHVISVPAEVKWRVTSMLHELHATGLTRYLTSSDLVTSDCLATGLLIPPFYYEYKGRSYIPCYVQWLDVGVPELTYEVEEQEGGPRFYSTRSHGEVSYALFKAMYDVARELSGYAKSELGVSVTPIIYLDDAFEGLDVSRMRELLSSDFSSASIYATTHRLEAGEYASRNLLMTYNTRASEFVDQTPDFRFALVAMELVERSPHIFREVCTALLGEEACLEDIWRLKSAK